MSYAFDRMARGQPEGENNDCAVKALALVLNISYANAHHALSLRGRERGQGTLRADTMSALESLGFHVRRRLTAEAFGLEVGTKRPTPLHARLHPEAWAHLPHCLLFMPRHVAAFAGGKVEDWTGDTRAPIEEVWEVVGPGLPNGRAPEVIHL
jgi:hypothetical protein